MPMREADATMRGLLGRDAYWYLVARRDMDVIVSTTQQRHKHLSMAGTLLYCIERAPRIR